MLCHKRHFKKKRKQNIMLDDIKYILLLAPFAF